MTVRTIHIFSLLAFSLSIGSSAGAGFQTPALLEWQDASGPVSGYAVFVKRNGALFSSVPDQYVDKPLVRIRGFDGDVVRVRVRAFDEEGRLGPYGPASQKLIFPVIGTPSEPTACAQEECIAGGGSRKTDCHAEFRGDGLELNYPPFDPNREKQKKQTEVRCTDGDPACDHDGLVNDSCRFSVDVCLRVENDSRFPDCEAADVVKIRVQAKSSPLDAASLEEALDFLLPATAPVCTSGRFVDSPIKRSKSGKARKSTTYVKVTATTDPKAKDNDRLRLQCMPAP